MSRIEQFRFVIDDIDKNIIRLFEKRMEISEKIAQYKLENNLEILNVSREDLVMKSAIKELDNKNYTNELILFISNLTYLSRKIQTKKIESIVKNHQSDLL